MDNDRLWGNLIDLSIICGMNQRYAQYMLTRAEWWSNAVDVMVVITTMLAMCATVAAYLKPEAEVPIFPWWKARTWSPKKRRLDGMATLASISAAIAGVILVVTPFSDEVQHYSAMLHAWSDLRQDVDSALVDADRRMQDGDAYLEIRLRDLLAKKNALNAREPAPNQSLLEECLAMEERSRGSVDAPPKESPATNTSILRSPGI